VSFNPLRNEADAFRVLLWFIAVMAVIVGIVLLIRAVS
jgi:cytochrome c-type biogenesis protein CcmH/NrfF